MTTLSHPTRARAVALGLIAVVAGGLASIRAGTHDRPAVHVPGGAQPGDLTLHACHYDTEDGSYAADCGTLVVPENRHDQRTHLIGLPVVRVRARTAAGRPPLFRLEGGPGRSNMTFPEASRFAADRDVVLVGYRGVDSSTRLDCPEVTDALRHSRDLVAASSARAQADSFRRCADRLTGEGVDLGGYSLSQRVDDFDAARLALGYDRVDLIGESAGTRTALMYADRYPQHVHRSVLLGVNPPGHFLWDGSTTDAVLDRWAARCGADRSCRDRTSDLVASMRATAADMPSRWWFLPIKAGNVRLASFFGLVHATDAAAPVDGPTTVDAWLSAAEGDPSGLWLMSVMADVTLPRSFVWGDRAAVARADAGAARAHFADPAQRASVLADAGSRFVWGDGGVADAWPATPDDDAYPAVRDSDVETLLVAGELDAATPARVAHDEVLPHLRHGREVVLSGFGHTDDVWHRQADAGTHLVTTFLDDGTVDASRYRPEVADFTPLPSDTMIAKIVAGSSAATVAAAVVLLAWLGARVRRGRTLGPRAGAATRTVAAAFVGLGGWCAGAIAALVALPTVPLDDVVLALMATGLPVGGAVHLATVQQGWSVGRRHIGLAAVLAGAVAGTWLGAHAATDGVQIMTGVLGAVAGANLAAIVGSMAAEPTAADAASDTVTQIGRAHV